MSTYLDVPRLVSEIQENFHNKDKNFRGILYQFGSPLFDVELNSMQEIQKEFLQSMALMMGNSFYKDGYKVIESSTDTTDNFEVTKGICVLNGQYSFLADNFEYKNQVFTNPVTRKFMWDDLTVVPTITTPVSSRTDLVVLCLVLEEVNSSSDPSIKINAYNRESAIRWKLNIGIRVLEGVSYATYNEETDFMYKNENYAVRIPIAEITRSGENILTENIVDKRSVIKESVRKDADTNALIYALIF